MALRASDMKPGEKAVIHYLQGPEEHTHRLASMGLVAGTEIRLLRLAPAGDPLVFVLRGYTLGLCRRLAACVVLKGSLC